MPPPFLSFFLGGKEEAAHTPAEEGRGRAGGQPADLCSPPPPPLALTGLGHVPQTIFLCFCNYPIELFPFRGVFLSADFKLEFRPH